MKYFKHETAIVDSGAVIGEGCRIWHWTHINSGAKVGNNTMLGQNVYVGSKAIIGNGVKIQNNVSIFDNVIIEDDVFCGPSMVFTNITNPRAFVSQKEGYKDTIVRKGATLGANCTILCGVIIGEYSLIGAGAVVTKDVKPYSLVMGVPAKQVGWVSRMGEVLSDNLVCPIDGTQYILKDEHLVSKDWS